MNKKKLIFPIIIVSFVLVMSLVMPILNITSNCGGNSAALSVCSGAIYYLASEGEKKTWTLSELRPQERLEIQKELDNFWIKGMEYKILKNKVDFGGKVPVIVCSKMYSNVPQPTPWNFYAKTPRHAVGFSDGTTGLITDEEYNKIDWSQYDHIKQSPESKD